MKDDYNWCDQYHGLIIFDGQYGFITPDGNFVIPD